MTKGPRGERRPSDVVGCAVTVAKIAVGEIDDTQLAQPAKRGSGLAAKARSAALGSQIRSEIASIAAAACRVALACR